MAHGAEVDLDNVLQMTPLMIAAGMRGTGRAGGGAPGGGPGPAVTPRHARSRASTCCSVPARMSMPASSTSRTHTAKIMAYVQGRDQEGRTALFAAAEAGSDKVVRHLLDRGADPALRDAAGKTALDAARAPPPAGPGAGAAAAAAGSPAATAAAASRAATIALLEPLTPKSRHRWSRGDDPIGYWVPDHVIPRFVVGCCGDFGGLRQFAPGHHPAATAGAAARRPGTDPKRPGCLWRIPGCARDGYASYASLFARDGVWTGGLRQRKGPAESRQCWRRILARRSRDSSQVQLPSDDDHGGSGDRRQGDGAVAATCSTLRHRTTSRVQPWPAAMSILLSARTASGRSNRGRRTASFPGATGTHQRSDSRREGG